MLKILVVDDEQTVRRLIEKTLTRLGHDVLLAKNGEQAWNIIQDEPIRLVLTGWDMPLMNGIQLIKKIRSTTLPGYVYTILIPPNGKNENIVEGLYAGTDLLLASFFTSKKVKISTRYSVRELDWSGYWPACQSFN